jgi:hypothetical protein
LGYSFSLFCFDSNWPSLKYLISVKLENTALHASPLACWNCANTKVCLSCSYVVCFAYIVTAQASKSHVLPIDRCTVSLLPVTPHGQANNSEMQVSIKLLPRNLLKASLKVDAFSPFEHESILSTVVLHYPLKLPQLSTILLSSHLLLSSTLLQLSPLCSYSPLFLQRSTLVNFTPF